MIIVILWLLNILSKLCNLLIQTVFVNIFYIKLFKYNNDKNKIKICFSFIVFND